ncbi:MAG: hypothetical protein LBB66_01325 [Desulfovibrio sp.]|jgi:hypothetical protein|nr:hypothetical protein [Desulfovibrio sp.]
MHFTLVKINPENAHPSHGFDDVILPLYCALRRLGFAVEILFNRVNGKSRNIVFGSCITPRRTGRMLPGGSIVFNLEQIVPGNKWANSEYLAHLRGFDVWDYSPANTRELRLAGVASATCVPLGYVPEMTRLAQDCPAEVEALFYGLVSDRRHTLMQRLLQRGVRVLCPGEAFGDLRDRLLTRSRLVLNIHNVVPARLEMARLGYVWANRKAVLSEAGEGDEIPDDLREACVFAAYDDFPETAARLLTDRNKLERQAGAGFRAFAARPLARTLEGIVGRRVYPASGVAERAMPPLREWLITDDML